MSLKSSELLKEEILKLEEEIGCGFLIKSIDSKKEDQNSVPNKPEKQFDRKESGPKTPDYEPIEDEVVYPSPVIKSEVITDSQSPIESLSNQSNHDMTQPIALTKEDLMSSLKTLFTVKLESEDEASLLVAIIESLKDSLMKYYKVIPTVITTPLVSTPQSKSVDNYEVCEMDEC